MSDHHQFQRTLDDADLLALPGVERCSGPWGPELPQVLGEALSTLPELDPFEAERILATFLDEHGDAPEVWWGLAVAMVAQSDMANASTCYENFRDRVEIEAALALQECGTEPAAARSRLARLAPSLLRCRDHLLAVRGLIMASGLELMFGDTEQASRLLRAAHPRIRSLWPRPWGVVAEWLATVAIAIAERTEGLRPERSLRLALRMAHHEPDNRERIAAIGRDLGLLLNRSDRVAEAESIYAAAMSCAEGGASVEMRASIAIAQAENLRVQRRYLEAFARLDEALANQLPNLLRALALLASADMMSRLGSAHRDRKQIATAALAAAEAAALLERAGLDPMAAVRDRGLAEALLGDSAAARRTFFTLLRGQEARCLTPSERVALGYLAYLIRMADGCARKALGWAEYRLRTSLGSQLDRPRDVMLLREHCVAAAERLGDIATVRRHAMAMLEAEAAMLRIALGDGRGPADWNRMRVAREALSILASMEAGSNEPGARWRQTEVLLAGRGLARAARRSLRREPHTETGISVRDFIARLPSGEVLLGLVSLHSPAPVDPEFPWASGFSAPRLLAIRLAAPLQEPEIVDLGDFADCATVVRRWTRDIAVGRAARTPDLLRPVEAWLRDASAVYVLAEGALELAPIGLLAPASVIRQISGVRERRDRSASTAPLLVVASDMLEGSFAAATAREIALVRSRLPDARLPIGTAAGVAGVLELLADAPRHIHVVAHGTAVLDPRATGLDVYEGAAIALGSELLTASRIADLHLEGVELVVLSACDSAAGAAQHAEGLASMAAAFLDAGAGAVIATLWPVPHAETAAFMQLLYAQDLGDPAAALTKARKQAEAGGLAKACWAAWAVHENGSAV